MWSFVKQCAVQLVMSLCLLGIVTPHTLAQSALPDLSQTKWLVLGPFDVPVSEAWADITSFHRDYLTELGGEAQARPASGQKTSGTQWKPLRAATMPVNFNQAFGQRTNCVVYAYTEFEASAAQPAALKLGSDDGIKVWFNGNLLLSHHVARAINPDDEALSVTIQPGVNRLLIKIIQGEGDWGFSARFLSLAEEQQDWERVAAPGLAVRPLDKIVFTPETFACTVMTVPALAVPEPVQITVRDQQGNVLLTASGVTGQLAPLPLPADFTGSAIVNVAGQQKTAAVTVEENILFGDPERISNDLVRQARELAANIDVQTDADDVRATLLFYADVLEGKLHSSLTTVARRLAALETLQTLTARLKNAVWTSDAVRGLQHWAYTSPIDQSLQPYSLYVPESYAAAHAYSLIVALHWYTGDDLSIMQSLAIDRLRPQDFIVVAPFGRGDLGYLSIGEQDVLDVLAKIQARFTIDPDRIYLTGISMGGLGTWRVGQHFAEKFAAIAAFAGWTGTDYLDNLRNVAVLLVHGKVDTSVPVQYDREAAAHLQALPADVQYEELPGVGHNAWDQWILQQPYEERLLNYFRAHRRNPWPTEVSLKTNYPRYGQQAWVRLLDLTDPFENGSINAKIDAAAQITVATQNVNLFAINLAHPQFAEQPSLTVQIDTTSLKLQPPYVEVFFRREGTQWVLSADDRNPAIAPHHGGGLADVVVGPVLIVYGTQQRAATYKKAAELFANWEVTPQIRIGTKAGRFRIKADTELTDEDVRTHNLILLGGPERNLITQRIAAKIPITFAENMIEVGGKVFSRVGCSITYPNPLAPERLVGIITLPFNDSDIEQIWRYTYLQFIGYNVDETATVPRNFPDVLVYTSLNFQQPAEWVGWFDYTWQNLRGSEE